MAQETQPLLVQALFPFKGTNNDELCFKKGDVITITQVEEGGWWEGTLEDKTGWFPSNYVKEYKVQDGPGEGMSPIKTLKDSTATQKAYRSVVIKDFADAERAHIIELKSLLSNYLTPIEHSSILTKDELKELVSNLNEVILVSENLLGGLDGSRVGRHLLSTVVPLKQALTNYCARHPSSVQVINKHRQELETLLEGTGGSVLGLTGGLSRPFRRLEKYIAHIQELERHMEESHPDRGDTQRALALYKDIVNGCTSVRRQKELEIEIITGGVRGWEGAPLSQLGPVLYVGSVAVGPQHVDRYLVLFSSTLLVLSVSPRISAFIYEGKLPLTGIKVVKLEDSETYKNAFEISGPYIETITAVCQTKEDQIKWVSLISQQSAALGAKPPPHNCNKNSQSDEVDGISSGAWNVAKLRPSPPIKSCLRGKNHEINKPAEKGFEEEAQILQVIEAYCSSSRYTLNSESSPLPSTLKKDFRPLTKDSPGSVSLEQVLTDVVVGLQDQLATLDTKLSNLSNDIAHERSAREQLQALVLNTSTPQVQKTYQNNIDNQVPS